MEVSNSIIVIQQILPDRHRMALLPVKRPVYELHLRYLSDQGKLQLLVTSERLRNRTFYQSRQTVTTGKWTSTAALVIDNAVFQPANLRRKTNVVQILSGAGR